MDKRNIRAIADALIIVLFLFVILSYCQIQMNCLLCGKGCHWQSVAEWIASGYGDYFIHFDCIKEYNGL